MIKKICEVCGKEIDPRGMKMHMLSHSEKQVTTPQIEENPDKEIINEPETTMTDKIQEVKLNPEEDIAKKVKDESKKEEEFNSCPDCNQTFKGFPNFCPKCGCEFE